MNQNGRDAAAGVAGGLMAGAVLSGVMLLLERSGRGPSDLVLIERRGARELHLPHRRMGAPPDMREQTAGHTGHLLLAAALGSGLGIIRRGLGTTLPKAGLLLGLGFYPFAFGLLGPLLGLTRAPWRERPAKVGQNILMHALFGAVTGLVADRIERQASPARAKPQRTTKTGHLRYSDDVEEIGPDEDKTVDRIIAVMGEGGRITRERYGHAVRTSHAKAHGLLKGELRVLDNLPEPLRQGLFATPKTFPVVVRLSHVPGELLDDRKVSTPRGLAIKIFDAEGPKVAGHEGENTHDFVLDTGKAFIASTAKLFLAEITATEAATPLPQAAKQAVSATSRAANAVLNAVGLNSATLDFYGHPKLHPLAEPYFTQVPIRYGDYVAKLGIFPDTARLRALAEKTVAIDDENGLRTAVVEFFRSNPAEFEVRVQLCTDLDSMPVEDASVEWPEDRSPYQPVARLVFPPQDAWSAARQAHMEEALSFAPSHCLAAHRPLGSIMRARMKAYAVLGSARRRENGKPVREPRSISEVPD
jgi:hypothetical protein